MNATLPLAALLLGTAPALAAPAVGLVGDRTLVMFDTEAPMVTATVDVSGIQSLAGIDLRPANGTLVGVSADNVVVTIDLSTGAATRVSTMDVPLPMMAGQPVIVDFNPAADKLRYMTGTTNHRVDVDSGKVTVDGGLAFEAGDMHAGEAPAIVAAAYAPSFGKPEATKMYDIDATIAALIRQTAPNDGTLAAVGKLGLAAPGDNFAFDIQTTADMVDTAWLVNGATLYTVDLATGTATAKGEITGAPGPLRDIAILPAM